MRAIRGRDTKPELVVRRLASGLGYRYRLHGRGLPGRPDLVFRGRRRVLFVHGCFWHLHLGKCKRAGLPKSRLEFWLPKLEANRRRDRSVEAKLRMRGWRVLVIWECQLNDIDRVRARIVRFMGEQ